MFGTKKWKEKSINAGKDKMKNRTARRSVYYGRLFCLLMDQQKRSSREKYADPLVASRKTGRERRVAHEGFILWMSDSYKIILESH